MLKLSENYAPRAKIFISYSRKDAAFAQELLAGLEVAGFESYLDTHDIAGGEEWEARLGRLIEAADTVVFVLSPDAVASRRCAWEIDRADRLKKRLMPIVGRPVEAESVPARLRQLNYIYFDKPGVFGTSLRALSNALGTDIDWIREHTRIGEAALRWEQRGRVEALLWRGEELTSAKEWLKAQPRYAQEPTILHHEFIKASDVAEEARASIERRHLEQVAAAQDEREKALVRAQAALRQTQLAQTVVAILLTGVAAGLAGWYHQDYLRERYQWNVVMRPAVLSSRLETALSAQAGAEFTECAHGCPTMVVIPKGRQILGSPDSEKERGSDEGPRHEVLFARSFAVARTELTFAQWDACVAARVCQPVPDSDWGRNQRPVINVSWEDAQTYVRWLSRSTGMRYRLLSEAEWEYAARAGGDGRYSFGDDEARLGEFAWFRGNAGDRSQPVATRGANAFGLHDMHGNVWEWVEDCNHTTYDGAPVDGSAWTSACADKRRMLRGGSWFDAAPTLRAANRIRHPVGDRADDVGIRVARDLRQ